MPGHTQTTMEDIAGILLLVFVVLILPWLLWLRSRHLREKAQQDFDSRWNELSSRISSVEAALDKLRSSTSSLPVATPVTAAARDAVTATAYNNSSEPTRLVDKPVPAESPAPAVTFDDRQSTEELTASFTRQESSAPSFASIGATNSPSWIERLKGGFDLEEALGTNWLNKIGVVILVLGIAFFLAYQLRELGPGGKVLVGFVISSVLLGGGIFLERKPGYALLARAGVGGGWALGFFTTYAMYHVQAARVSGA